MKTILINQPEKKIIKVRKDEEVEVVLVISKPGDYQVRVELLEQGAKAYLRAVMRVKKGRYQVLTEMVHKQKNTHAETIFHGVLKGEAKAEIKGMIKIDKKAHQVTDFLTEKVLLMSDNAWVIVEPSLEIEADEVRASHAATVSKIDDRELFYLMSRGLDKSGAEEVIEAGFLETVIKKIKDGKIQKKIYVEYKKN